MNTTTTPLDAARLIHVVTAATLAPSVLNCQPWRFHAYDEVIDLHVDRDRQPAALDPQGREVMISMGAALSY